MSAAAPPGSRTTILSPSAPRAAAARLVAPLWLLLAAILTHALIPVGSPLARTSGSAFSATTLDVSLAPRKGEEALRTGSADADRNDGAVDGGPFIAGAAPAAAAPRLASGPPPGSHRAATPLLDLFPKTARPRAPPSI